MDDKKGKNQQPEAEIPEEINIYPQFDAPNQDLAPILTTSSIQEEIVFSRPTLVSILETSENGKSDALGLPSPVPDFLQGSQSQVLKERGGTMKGLESKDNEAGVKSDIQILLSNTQTNFRMAADDQGTGSGAAPLSPKASEHYLRPDTQFSQKTRSAADSKSVALGMRKLRFDDVFDQTRVGQTKKMEDIVGDKNYKSVIVKTDKDKKGAQLDIKKDGIDKQRNENLSPGITSLGSHNSKQGGFLTASNTMNDFLQLNKKKKFEPPPRMKKYKRLVEDVEYLSQENLLSMRRLQMVKDKLQKSGMMKSEKKRLKEQSTKLMFDSMRSSINQRVSQQDINQSSQSKFDETLKLPKIPKHSTTSSHSQYTKTTELLSRNQNVEGKRRDSQIQNNQSQDLWSQVRKKLDRKVSNDLHKVDERIQANQIRQTSKLNSCQVSTNKQTELNNSSSKDISIHKDTTKSPIRKFSRHRTDFIKLNMIPKPKEEKSQSREYSPQHEFSQSPRNINKDLNVYPSSNNGLNIITSGEADMIDGSSEYVKSKDKHSFVRYPYGTQKQKEKSRGFLDRLNQPSARRDSNCGSSMRSSSPGQMHYEKPIDPLIKKQQKAQNKMLMLFKTDRQALQNYLKNKKKQNRTNQKSMRGLNRSMDLRKVADMYNGDILKPDALSPARIESMHSPRTKNSPRSKNKTVKKEKEYQGNKLDLDIEITTERTGYLGTMLNSLQTSSMYGNEPQLINQNNKNLLNRRELNKSEVQLHHNVFTPKSGKQRLHLPHAQQPGSKPGSRKQSKADNKVSKKSRNDHVRQRNTQNVNLPATGSADAVNKLKYGQEIKTQIDALQKLQLMKKKNN